MTRPTHAAHHEGLSAKNGPFRAHGVPHEPQVAHFWPENPRGVGQVRYSTASSWKTRSSFPVYLDRDTMNLDWDRELSSPGFRRSLLKVRVYDPSGAS